MPILTYDFRTSPRSAPSIRRWGRSWRGRRRGWASRSSPDPLPEEGLFTRSDHYKFVRAGRALGVPDDRLRRRGPRALHRASSTRAITGPSDDLASRSTGGPGARFAQLNYLIAREIADGAEAPLWYADSFFGDAFGGEPAAGAAARALRPAARRCPAKSAADAADKVVKRPPISVAEEGQHGLDARRGSGRDRPRSAHKACGRARGSGCDR